MCGDATNWDEEAYRDTILKEHELQTLTVFRTAWPPSLNPIPHSVVVASSHGTLSSYSLSSCVSNLPLGFNIGNAQRAKRSALLRGHDGPVYDVKFYGDGEDALLLSCGADGRIRGWIWKEFAESEVPILLQGPWDALSPVPENNAIAVDTQGGCIFIAAGDSCAYCWDVETCKVKMVFKGHLDYVHCVVARKCANQITGSEDGTARIGACSSGRCLSVWNIPASECISCTSCRASIQDVTFNGNQWLGKGCQLGDCDNLMYSVSDSSCWGRTSVELRTPKWHYSFANTMRSPVCILCLFTPNRLTAIGGYGGLVDIISQFGSHYRTFQCGYS